VDLVKNTEIDKKFIYEITTTGNTTPVPQLQGLLLKMHELFMV